MLITVICYWPAKSLVLVIKNALGSSMLGEVSDIHGTLWQGNLKWNANSQTNAIFPFVIMQWRLKPFCLLTMTLCADVRLRDTDDQTNINSSKLQLQSSLALHYRPWLKEQPFSWIDIKSLQGFLTPDTLNVFNATPWLKTPTAISNIEINNLYLTLNPNTLETKNARGSVTWAGGAIETQLAVLGLPAPSGWQKQNYPDVQFLLTQENQKTRILATSNRVKPHLLNILLGENRIQVEVFGAAARWANQPTAVANDELLIGFAQPLSSFVKGK